MEKEQSQLLHSNLLLLVINMVETQFLFRLDPVGQTVTTVVDLVGDESHEGHHCLILRWRTLIITRNYNL